MKTAQVALKFESKRSTNCSLTRLLDELAKQLLEVGRARDLGAASLDS